MEYRLVIIDDEKEISGGFAMFFPWKTLGYVVSAQFGNAYDALDFLRTHEVDLVVSDVKMPGMDGLAMAEEMKRMQLVKMPRLVFFSAYDEFQYAQKALDCGAVKYILKTTPYDELVSIFQQLKECLDCDTSIISDSDLNFAEIEDGGDKILLIIKSYIDTHIDSVNLEVLAEQVYMSPAYVSRYFKQKTGQNFQEYLIAMRMKRAAELLCDIRYQISDVSELVGYKNPFNFSRTFKKFYGENPRDYRLKKLGRVTGSGNHDREGL